MRKRRKIACIYKIVAPNGKFYIGSTVDSYLRKASHWSDIKRGKHGNRKLTHSFAKYGIENMVFEIILCLLPGANKFEVEQQFLDELKPELNISMYANTANDPGVRGRIRIAMRESEKCKTSSLQNLQLAIKASRIPVVRNYDMMEFESRTAAAEFMGYRTDITSKIEYALRSKNRCPKGYFWKFKNDPTPFSDFDAMEWKRAEQLNIGSNPKAVIRLTDGRKFKSMTIAAKYCEINNPNGIGMAIKRNGICGGHKWAWDESIDPTS